MGQHDFYPVRHVAAGGLPEMHFIQMIVKEAGRAFFVVSVAKSRDETAAVRIFGARTVVFRATFDRRTPPSSIASAA